MITPLIQRYRRRASQESGVVIVLVAFMLTIILGAAALAIDLGSFYKAQRQAQAAADAGALAAVQDLPANPTQAAADGTTYASTNYPDATSTVQTNYNGNLKQVKVTVNAQSPAFFGRFFGLTSANVSASAVAGATGASAPVAIYANDNNGSDPSCTGGITLTGNNETIGGVESNGGVSLSGSNNSLTAVMDGVNGTNSCTFNANGNNVSLGGTPMQNATATAFPLDYTNHLPACTFPPQGNWSWVGNGSQVQIPDGVYCAIGTGNANDPSTWNGNITIASNNLQPAKATFIGGSFSFSGNSGGTFSPYDASNPVLIYQTGSADLTINGNQFLSGGVIEAKSANCVINGNSNNGPAVAYSGLVECNNVTVNGNNFTFSGVGPVIGGGGGGLLQ